MSNPHDPSDGRAVTHDPYVPALDGLRGLAALLVAGAHYMTMEGGAPLSEIVQTLTGLGMTLFFVLSGFVIYYNYNATITRPGGLRFFSWRASRGLIRSIFSCSCSTSPILG
jgi:peptidoglycan/LPS O-acetylase OafA/YrhL